jgi:MFS family permease
VRERGSGVPLAGGLGLVTLVLFATYAAVLSVLLPTLVARIDPVGKIAALAIVTSISFGVTALAQPVIGALSDRTRGRWGRRSPWMLGGAVVGGAAVAALGGAASIPALAVLWAVGQFALNGTDIASTTFLVDRYPPSRRARIAAVFGVAAIGGGALGTVLAGRMSATPLLASSLFAVATVVVVLAFVLVVRDAAPGDAPEPFTWRQFLSRFVVDPRRSPAFAWLFASRFAFGVAYQAVHGYLFFIITDHLEIAEASATELIGVITAVGGASVIVAIVAVAWASDRIGRRRPFLVAAGILGSAAAVLGLAVPQTWAIFVMAVALGASLGTVLVAGTALASETVPGGAQGAGLGLGLYNLGTNVAQAVGPLLALLAITALGGYPALFACAAVGMLASAALVVPIRGRR